MPYYKDLRNIYDTNTDTNFNKTEYSYLFSMKYGLSNRYVVYRREVNDFYDVLTKFGGMLSLLTAIFSLFGTILGSQYL